MTVHNYTSSLTGQPFGPYIVVTYVDGVPAFKDSGLSEQGAHNLKRIMELVKNVTCEVNTGGVTV